MAVMTGRTLCSRNAGYIWSIFNISFSIWRGKIQKVKWEFDHSLTKHSKQSSAFTDLPPPALIDVGREMT